MCFNPEGSRVDFNLFGEYDDISTNSRVILAKNSKLDTMVIHTLMST